VEPERARELLAQERKQLESALQLRSPSAEESGRGARELGDEQLQDEQLDESRRRELEAQLAAVERAEERLRRGTYGRSVLSGEPIPDARLEARPSAELTVEEQQTQGR
jgi:DnaK suppressor protein